MTEVDQPTEPILRPDHRPGDVVLMRNDSPHGITPILTALTLKLDKSPFGHSGLMIGLDEMSHIGADGSENTSLSIRTSPTSNYGLVASFRPVGLDADTTARVVAEGRRLGDASIEYSEVQMVLAGFMLRHRAVPWYLRWTIPTVLPALAALINRKIDEGEEMMICSDYVYRCFAVAGFDLLPGGLPDLSGGADLTIDAWLASVGDVPSGDPSGDPSPPAHADLSVEAVDERLRAGDVLGVLTDPRHDSGPDRDEPSPDADDAILAGDPTAIRAAITAFDQAIAAAGPSPAASDFTQFVTPGDLWRSERLVEHDRWIQDDRD